LEEACRGQALKHICTIISGKEKSFVIFKPFSKITQQQNKLECLPMGSFSG
jgi:hypothetical protein